MELKKNNEFKYIVIVSIVRKCFRTLTLPTINTNSKTVTPTNPFLFFLIWSRLF